MGRPPIRPDGRPMTGAERSRRMMDRLRERVQRGQETPAPPLVEPIPADLPTLAAGRTQLNLTHLRLTPDATVPWLVDRLADDTTPPALSEDLGRVLYDLAHVLTAIAKARVEAVLPRQIG
jgi:hypothetical protein